MYGYDLSSRSAMLKRGWYSLIRFASRIERVRLGGHDDRVEGLHLLHQRARLHALAMVVRDVAPHARAQPLRLAHVQHLPVRVLPEIDAGRFGKVRDLVEDRLRDGHGELYPRPRRRRSPSAACSRAARGAVASGTPERERRQAVHERERGDRRDPARPGGATPVDEPHDSPPRPAGQRAPRPRAGRAPPAAIPVRPMRAVIARRSSRNSTQPAIPADAVRPAAPVHAGRPSSRGSGKREQVAEHAGEHARGRSRTGAGSACRAARRRWRNTGGPARSRAARPPSRRGSPRSAGVSVCVNLPCCRSTPAMASPSTRNADRRRNDEEGDARQRRVRSGRAAASNAAGLGAASSRDISGSSAAETDMPKRLIGQHVDRLRVLEQRHHAVHGNVARQRRCR